MTTTQKAGLAYRYKLEIPGTAATAARELEAAVDAAEWTHLQTRIESRKGHTRVYFACDQSAVELVARELAGHLPARHTPAVEQYPPTTWEKIHATQEALREHRKRVGRNAVIPPSELHPYR